MKENVALPRRLIDITGLPLAKIEETATGGLRIGALVPNSDLAYDERIATRYPLLSSAILAGASAQLRNMASTGGNLLQRTRCLYFYDTTTACNKREPGSGCAARDGFNRMNAILGWSESCIAVHPSDMCVALAALEATVHVTGPKGDRSIPFAEFHRLPGHSPEFDTNLASDELVTSVELPPEGFRPQLHLSEDQGSICPTPSRLFPSPSALSLRRRLSRSRALRWAGSPISLGGFRPRRRFSKANGRAAKFLPPRLTRFCKARRALPITVSRTSWRGARSCAGSSRLRPARRSPNP